VPQRARAGRNRGLFRHVNERIADVAAGFAVRAERQEFVCECSRAGCAAMVDLSLESFDRIRDDPARFVVLAGHEDPGDDVVGRVDGCLLVSERRWAGQGSNLRPRD
jgi:hypothetical protein